MIIITHLACRQIPKMMKQALIVGVVLLGLASSSWAETVHSTDNALYEGALELARTSTVYSFNFKNLVVYMIIAVSLVPRTFCALSCLQTLRNSVRPCWQYDKKTLGIQVNFRCLLVTPDPWSIKMMSCKKPKLTKSQSYPLLPFPSVRAHGGSHGHQDRPGLHRAQRRRVFLRQERLALPNDVLGERRHRALRLPQPPGLSG